MNCNIAVLLFTTSTSSRGSFHRNLYLLDVSITLAAEYLRRVGKKKNNHEKTSLVYILFNTRGQYGLETVL